MNGGVNEILISLVRLKIYQKLLEKIQIKTKENFCDSINSIIAEKAFDLWGKQRR